MILAWDDSLKNTLLCTLISFYEMSVYVMFIAHRYILTHATYQKLASSLLP